jgi:hypothetical protein
MRVLVLGWLASCLSCSCARAPAGSEQQSARAPAAQTRAESDSAENERKALALGLLRTRFGPDLPRPSAEGRRRCPDETLTNPASAPVPLRLRDVRADRRQLLPLRLTHTLSTPSALSVAEYLRADDELSAGALEPLLRLADSRYLAELLVEVYQAPKLFRRKDAPRSEWSAAVLNGRLVVYDVIEARPLCDAPLDVRISGDGQPIRRRLRDVTRERMTSELERAARAELERALRAASNAFRLEPWSGDGRSQLLAELSR